MAARHGEPCSCGNRSPANRARRLRSWVPASAGTQAMVRSGEPASRLRFVKDALTNARMNTPCLFFLLSYNPRSVPCRSEEHTSELQSLMRISYAVFCLKKNNTKHKTNTQA